MEKSIPVLQEWSVQVEIGAKGTIEPVALTRLFSGPNGGYLGTVISESDQENLAQFVRYFSPVLKNIAEQGYFGALGLDLIESTDGSFKLLEINGRLTMGRVAFEWHRRLGGHFASLYTHLFVKIETATDETFLYGQIAGLVKMEEADITILNMIADMEGRMVMVALLIQSSDPEQLPMILGHIKNRLKKGLMQV